MLWICFSSGSLPWLSFLAWSHCNCPSVLSDCQSHFSLLILFPFACQFQWDWKNDSESQEFVLKNVLEEKDYICKHMEGRVSARKTELPIPPPRNLMALKSMLPGGIVELLPLLLLGKRVMRGHERGWRQFAWKFRGHEEDLEGSVKFQGCGGLEVLISERWMWLGVWIVPACISLSR